MKNNAKNKTRNTPKKTKRYGKVICDHHDQLPGECRLCRHNKPHLPNDIDDGLMCNLKAGECTAEFMVLCIPVK